MLQSFLSTRIFTNYLFRFSPYYVLKKMFSKFLRPIVHSQNVLLKRRVKLTPTILFRKTGDMLPPHQYQVPLPKRLHLSYALTVYWEIIPLFIATVTSLGLMFFSIAWACKNKVDVVFTSRNRRNISRTMDLRNPSIHKLFIINQRYDPWPEMQAVLDKMVTAEKRAIVRLKSCAHA